MKIFHHSEALDQWERSNLGARPMRMLDISINVSGEDCQQHSGTYRKNVWRGLPSQQDDEIHAANDSLQQEEDQLKHS